MKTRVETAREVFLSGCNCAQAVLTAFCGDAGLDREAALRIASSFGGGIGGMREMCGALTGAMMVGGLLQGYGDGCTPEIKKEHDARVQALAEAFGKRFGYTNCRDLLRRNEEDGSAAAEEKPCMKFVVGAVEILERALGLSP